MFENIFGLFGAEIWEMLGRIFGVGMILFIFVGIAVMVFLVPIFWRKFIYGG